jgi:hypothetical protein
MVEEEGDDDSALMLGQSVPIDIPMMKRQPAQEATNEGEPGDFQPPHSLAQGDEFSARETIVGRIKSDGTWTGEKGYSVAQGT